METSSEVSDVKVFILRWSGTPVVRYSGKSTGAMKNLEPWNKETGITELACADICTSLFVCVMLVFNILLR